MIETAESDAVPRATDAAVPLTSRPDFYVVPVPFPASVR